MGLAQTRPNYLHIPGGHGGGGGGGGETGHVQSLTHVCAALEGAINVHTCTCGTCCTTCQCKYIHLRTYIRLLPTLV